MDHTSVGARRRRARRHIHLGPDTACALCGTRNGVARLVRIPRSILEAHHVVFKAHDAELVVPLCRPCHNTLHDDLLDAGVSPKPAPTILERVVNILRALAEFFITLGGRFRQWAEELLHFMARLDTRCPRWRTWKAAQ